MYKIEISVFERFDVCEENAIALKIYANIFEKFNLSDELAVYYIEKYFKVEIRNV